MSNTLPESLFVQKFRANTFTSRLPAAEGNNYGEHRGTDMSHWEGGGWLPLMLAVGVAEGRQEAGVR